MAADDTVEILIGHKAWANKRLFDKLTSIPDIESMKDIQVIIGTLNHAYVVDCIFKAHLESKSHSFKGVNASPLPSLTELYEFVAEIDHWYIDYADELSNDDLAQRLEFQFTSGEDASMLRKEVLLHVANHGTYHRGNVAVWMQQNSIYPDQDVLTDFIISRSN